MLIPRTYLLIWVALVVLPFSLLGTVVPPAALLSYTLILIFFTLLLLDAVLAYSSLDGINVELPKTLRFTKDREGMIELKITCANMKKKQLRLGLAFPYEILSPYDDLVVLLAQGTESSDISWPCTPVKRGVYHLDTCYLEGTSPMKFWAFRGSIAARTEIRVYPNLLRERNNLAALFLNRGGFGIHAQRQVGKGREFEKLREYIPGDSFDEIHWKATAKRRHPITKVYQIERTQEVYVLIDTSRLSARTGQSPESSTPPETHETETLLERFIMAALVMGLAAQKQGDRFGLVTFSNQVEGFVRASSGKAHYGACRDALYTLQLKTVNPDFDELGTFLRLRLRRRALLVLLTNLDDPILAESFVKNMNLISRQHLVLVNMIRPAAARPLFSHPDVSSIEDLYHELGGHALWHSLWELESVLHHHGIHFSLLDNEKLCVDLVTQYINVKQRQLL